MAYRVAIDARRQRDNGVARVTRLLISALSSTPHEAVLLGPIGTLHRQFPMLEAVEYQAPLLSTEDFYGLDHVLNRLRADCFIAPQFYNSPWTVCPQVRILHDTFPLEEKATLTTNASAEQAFGNGTLGHLFKALTGDDYSSKEGSAALAYQKYYELAVESASALLTVSRQSYADILRHFPQAACKLIVLPLFPDAAVIDPGASLEGRPIDVIHVSKFEPRKNQLTLLAAWRQVWQRRGHLRACIVGSPSPLFPDYGESVLRGIEEGVRDGWLEYHTDVDDTHLRDLYGSSLIACTPSTAEGFGLPVLEAMANGCVIVALRGTATEEVAADNAIYTDNSPGAIAVCLEEILASPGKRLRLARDSRSHAQGSSAMKMAAVLHQTITKAVTQEPDQSLHFRRRGILAAQAVAGSNESRRRLRKHG